MDKFAPDSSERSRSNTPGNPRFTSQAATAEDLLKAQTVGLVNLNDYRKRRAEALDRKERGDSTVSSGASTPLDGYDRRNRSLECLLICQVQSIKAKASFQEETQGSRERHAVIWGRRR